MSSPYDAIDRITGYVKQLEGREEGIEAFTV